MTKAYEALSKSLHKSLDNKEERLKYFDTYPYEPEEFYKRKERGLAMIEGSEGSTLANAREVLFGPSVEVGNSQATLAQSNQNNMPGAWPSDEIPVVQDERPSYTSPKTQLPEASVDRKLPAQNQMSDLRLKPRVEAEVKRVSKAMFEINDNQRSAVDSMRSLTFKFANEISQNQESVLTSAFNTLEATTSMLRAMWVDLFEHFTESEWEDMIKQEGKSGHLDDSPLNDFKRDIFPIHLASKILQESLSEASAETPKDQELPSWTAVMDFFEWRAGYAFERCLSDCAVISSEKIPDNKYVWLQDSIRTSINS